MTLLPCCCLFFIIFFLFWSPPFKPPRGVHTKHLPSAGTGARQGHVRPHLAVLHTWRDTQRGVSPACHPWGPAARGELGRTGPSWGWAMGSFRSRLAWGCPMLWGCILGREGICRVGTDVVWSVPFLGVPPCSTLGGLCLAAMGGAHLPLPSPRGRRGKLTPGLPRGTPSPCPGLGWDCASGGAERERRVSYPSAGICIPAGPCARPQHLTPSCWGQQGDRDTLTPVPGEGC